MAGGEGDGVPEPAFGAPVAARVPKQGAPGERLPYYLDDCLTSSLTV